MNIVRNLRWSGLLVVVGLIVQLLCLLRIHPFSFIAFLMIGCPLIASGVGLYVFGIVSQSEPK